MSLATSGDYEDLSHQGVDLQHRRHPGQRQYPTAWRNPTGTGIGWRGVTGTINITCLRDSGGAIDPEAVFEGIHKTHGRMQFVIQDDRTLLATGANDAVEPDPSDANPQYTSSAVISSIDYFGVADGNGGTAAVVSVTADLDRDFARRV